MIRDAKLEDIKSIMCLVSDFFIDSINEYGICMTEDTIEETLDNLIKHHIFLVNIKDGKVNGVISGAISRSIFDNKEIIAQEIIWFVDKDSRKGMDGIKLFNAFENKCKELGANKIIMVHMENSYPKSLERYYKRKNYKLMEKHYIREV